MPRGEKIIVGLSGGVDSAVAALLLLRAGARVEALHMSNWDDDSGYCSAAQDLRDAREVCRELGIPLHRVNFSTAYRDRVFAEFLAEYRAGRTPNPDVLCNREIKFDLFLEHARRLGADAIATGHYARAGGRTGLRMARDPDKDQTYFLHAVPRAALSACRFPIGGLRKPEVRDLATAAGLPVHEKRDSTGLCFIGERPFREFLGHYLDEAPGPMETPEGELVGRHSGLMFYTIGQRRGLGIGGRAGRSGAWYVAAKEPARNRLIVVQDRQHPLLWSRWLDASEPAWIAGEPRALSAGELHCVARIRHRQPPQPCVVRPSSSGGLTVRFDAPQWAIAPGQYVVFYAGDDCLGGARIARRLPGAAAGPATEQAAAALG